MSFRCSNLTCTRLISSGYPVHESGHHQLSYWTWHSWPKSSHSQSQPSNYKGMGVWIVWLLVTWLNAVRCNWVECWYYRPQYRHSISMFNNPWASYQIRQIVDWACAGNAGIVSTPPQVSDPDMYQGTCATHVPWCMPGSLTSSFLWSGGGNVPGILGVWITRKFTYLVRGPYRWTYSCEVCSSYRSLLDTQYVDGMGNYVKVLERLLICWLLL